MNVNLIKLQELGYINSSVDSNLDIKGVALTDAMEMDLRNNRHENVSEGFGPLKEQWRKQWLDQQIKFVEGKKCQLKVN